MVGMVKRLVQGTLACLCAGEVILSAQELEPDEVKVREKQLKSRKVPESYSAAWRLGGHYRSKLVLKRLMKKRIGLIQVQIRNNHNLKYEGQKI